jgi:uncharacterized protein
MQETTHAIRPRTFFLLTFILSWMIWIPLDLAHFGIGPLHIPEGTSSIVRLLGVLMPATAAMILTGIHGGKAGLKALFSRLKIWRVGWKWWAAAGLIQPALLVLAAVIFNLFGGTPAIAPIPLVSAAALSINIFFLLLATLGEEIGWRGVALPGLQLTRSAAAASIILGLLWAVWHIPFWLLMDTFEQFGVLYLILNFLLVLPGTFYITWFFNHTRSSLLLPVVFHLSFNILNTAILPVTLIPAAFALFIVLDWLVVLLIFRHLEPVHAQDEDRKMDTSSVKTGAK